MQQEKEVQHVYLVGAKSLGAYGGYETFVYKLTEYYPVENNTQLLKGVLEFCVLKFISREPTYGYEIVMHLKQVGFSDLSESTLYPLLLRLEQQGKVTVERRPSPKGPSRKYYVVTEEGRQALLEFRQDWSQLCQLVEKIFKEEPYE